MTLTVCSQFCGKTQYFGLEYSSECYCGSTIANTSIVTTESDCWMPCSGDSTAICGGNDRISIFRSLNYTTPVIPNPPAVPGYAYRGCYADKVGSRTIDGSYFFDEEMTTTKCAGLCGNSTYFGTEYGGECYCSSTFPTLARGLDGVACGSACKGDGTQACGGFNALSVY
ncbi:WSC-domain-containing protein, partial [Tothia fuscella]